MHTMNTTNTLELLNITDGMRIDNLDGRRNSPVKVQRKRADFTDVDTQTIMRLASRYRVPCAEFKHTPSLDEAVQAMHCLYREAYEFTREARRWEELAKQYRHSRNYNPRDARLYARYMGLAEKAWAGAEMAIENGDAFKQAIFACDVYAQ